MVKQPKTLEVGIAQINPTVGDFNLNQHKIIDYISQAEKSKFDLVIFPELSICGYPVWDLANKKSFVETNLQVLKNICQATKSYQITSIVGFIDFGKKKNGKNKNALAVIRNGKIILVQHKTLLPTYDVFLEEIFFEPASAHHTFVLNGIKIGTSICEDIWEDAYPVKPVKIMKRKGIQVLINISASPYHRKAPIARDDIVRKRAKENKIWLIYANQVGGQDDLVFDGRSFVADPRGKVVARAKPFREELFHVSIPLYERKLSEVLLGSLNEIQDIYEALLLGIRDYVEKNRFQKVVIGLSGGIDSALVATLAVDALGCQRVIGVTMPGVYSSKGSYEDSEILAKNLGIEFRKYPITPLYQAFLEQVAERKEVKNKTALPMTLANENLQARMRALELMYVSNDEGCLLLSTGNKSELAMGYCTIYGDMCGGLAVLGDVYKTDVYRIAQYRNQISKVIPKTIIEKAPSAELRPNQKDQDSLPPYEELDQILELYIEKNMSEKEIIHSLSQKGISKEVILDTIRKIEHNEYKRRQTPPLIRVTEKAWFGRRMPITNRFGKS
ncbi:MAG: NAD+ synthase [Candidatus Omnitrophica bacterium]|nr:NAD+ synthase [Candidatus Omnitrophota bacterium]